MTSKARLHVLLSLIGILGLIASLALAAGTMRPTEATWQDTVVGAAQFGAVENAGQNYARAMAIFGTMKRQITTEQVGPGRSDAMPRSDLRSGSMFHKDDGLAGILPLELHGFTCATITGALAPECGAPAPLSPGTSYAASEVSMIGLWAAAFEGIENLSYGTRGQSPIRATATCRPGESGTTAITAGGPLYVRDDTPLYLPPPNRQTFVDRPVATRNITGLLQNHQSSGPGWAKSELRLYAKSTRIGSSWTLHAVLASAECRLASSPIEEPVVPSLTAPDDIEEAPNEPATQTLLAQPAMAALQPITDLAEEELAEAQALEDAALEGAEAGKAGKAAETDTTAGTDELEPELPSLTDAAQAIEEESPGTAAADEGQDRHPVEEDTSEAATTTPVSSTTSPGTSAPAESDAQATETASAETSTSTPSTTVPVTTAPETTVPDTTVPKTSEPAATETTEPTTTTEATPGPQTSQDVTLGRQFTLTAIDGTDLGTATIEDVQHTADCGVEITLHITTSDEAGPDRLDSLGPSEFAEVSPSGATRDVQRVTSECEQAANSRTTTLQPGSSTRIVIAFQVSDTATAAMLRPDGTAGWTFPLT